MYSVRNSSIIASMTCSRPRRRRLLEVEVRGRVPSATSAAATMSATACRGNQFLEHLRAARRTSFALAPFEATGPTSRRSLCEAEVAMIACAYRFRLAGS